MPRNIAETVAMVHKEHGEATVPASSVERLKAAGWKKKTTRKPKEEVDQIG